MVGNSAIKLKTTHKSCLLNRQEALAEFHGIFKSLLQGHLEAYG